jgi:hypothetical protein
MSEIRYGNRAKEEWLPWRAEVRCARTRDAFKSLLKRFDQLVASLP